MSNADKVIKSPPAIISYPNLFEPRDFEGDGNFKYSCVLVMTEEDSKELQKVALATARKRWGKKGATTLKNMTHSLFKRTEEGDGYPEGTVWVRAKSDRAPAVFAGVRGPGGKPVPITDPNEVYAGSQVVAALAPYAYDKRGNKGVAFGLRGIVKTGEGERLDTSVSPDFFADELVDPEEYDFSDMTPDMTDSEDDESEDDEELV